MPPLIDMPDLLAARFQDEIAYSGLARDVADDDEIPRLHEADGGRMVGSPQQAGQDLVRDRAGEER